MVTFFHEPRHRAFYFHDGANAAAMRLQKHEARHGRVSGVLRDA